MGRPMTCTRLPAPIIARPAGFMSSSSPSCDTSFTHAGSALMMARSRPSLRAFCASADSKALGRFECFGLCVFARRARGAEGRRFILRVDSVNARQQLVKETPRSVHWARGIGTMAAEEARPAPPQPTAHRTSPHNFPSSRRTQPAATVQPPTRARSSPARRPGCCRVGAGRCTRGQTLKNSTIDQSAAKPHHHGPRHRHRHCADVRKGEQAGHQHDERRSPSIGSAGRTAQAARR